MGENITPQHLGQAVSEIVQSLRELSSNLQKPKISRYNVEFAIPEMVKTQKSLANRLQRDLVFAGIVLSYVFIFQKFTIGGFPLKYQGTNILYVSGIFIALYFSISLHLSKLLILYNQIDKEVKYFLSNDAKEEETQIRCATHMTSFVISENIVSDALVTGHTRHPSIRRFLILQFTLLFIAIGITYKTVSDIYVFSGVHFTPFFLLIMICSLYTLLQFFAVKYFFVYRSAFLSKASLGRAALSSYRELLLFNLPQQSYALTKSDNEYIKQAGIEYRKLPFFDIFDSDHYRIQIEAHLPKLLTIAHAISRGEDALQMFAKSQLGPNPKPQQLNQRIEQLRKGLNVLENVCNRAEEDYNKLQTTSEYALSFSYLMSCANRDRLPLNLGTYLLYGFFPNLMNS